MIVSNRRYMFGVGQVGVVRNSRFRCVVSTAPEGIFRGYSTVVQAFEGEWGSQSNQRIVAKATHSPGLPKETRTEIHESILAHIDRCGDEGTGLGDAIEMAFSDARGRGHISSFVNAISRESIEAAAKQMAEAFVYQPLRDYRPTTGSVQSVARTSDYLGRRAADLQGAKPAPSEFKEELLFYSEHKTREDVLTVQEISWMDELWEVTVKTLDGVVSSVLYQFKTQDEAASLHAFEVAESEFQKLAGGGVFDAATEVEKQIRWRCEDGEIILHRVAADRTFTVSVFVKGAGPRNPELKDKSGAPLADRDLVALVDAVLALGVRLSTDELRVYRKQIEEGAISDHDRKYVTAVCKRLLRQNAAATPRSGDEGNT